MQQSRIRDKYFFVNLILTFWRLQGDFQNTFPAFFRTKWYLNKYKKNKKFRKFIKIRGKFRKRSFSEINVYSGNGTYSLWIFHESVKWKCFSQTITNLQFIWAVHFQNSKNAVLRKICLKLWIWSKFSIHSNYKIFSQ